MSKYTLKCTKLHNFLKFSQGSMPPNPPSNTQSYAPRDIPQAGCTTTPPILSKLYPTCLNIDLRPFFSSWKNKVDVAKKSY